MIFIISTTVFLSIIFILVSMLLFVESKIVKKGNKQIVINNNEDKILEVTNNTTLLSALISNGILIPSACGGGGTCGTCKCVVKQGGGDVLPTELAHLSRQEKQSNVRLACQLKIKDDLNIQIPEEIFNIKKYQATVKSNYNIATFIKELILELDNSDELDFQAGAYIQIDIPAYQANFHEFEINDRYRDSWNKFNLWELKTVSNEPIFRAYSLASPPCEKKILRFNIRIATPPPNIPDAPPGIGSSYLFNLKQGDKVTLSGPYGDFFIKNTDREICFIGGGAGMAPMRCHIFHLLNDLRTKRKITFWYGARSKQEMLYNDEFKSLDEKYEQFSYNIALSDPLPQDNWQGMTGFIHQCLFDSYLSKHKDPTEIEYYLCGPPMMIDAVITMIDDLGVEPEMISYDKFS